MDVTPEVTPTPPRQRHRRSERYQDDAAATMPETAHPAPSSREASAAVAPRSTQPLSQAALPYQKQEALPVPVLRRPPSVTEHVPMGAVPVPRSLQQASADGFVPRQSRPTREEAGHTVRDEHRADEASAEEDTKSKRLPWYLSTGLVVLVLVAMALVAAMMLMQAYLKTQADAREAARQAMLSKYHVTEDRNGSMSVTYQALIERYAAEYNLQPAFVTAIIRNESSFRRDAESSVGARGLMQLMPDTAEWIAGKLNMADYSFDAMYDPETNIRFGCWYLGYLAKLFRGDPILVTAAYHTGQTTVTRWLSDRSVSADGLTIELDKMVDGPTKTYTGRVTLAYGIYHSLLYPDQPLYDAVYAVSAAGGTAASLTAARR